MKMIMKKQIKKLIDLDLGMDINIQNVACSGKIGSISNKQHRSNI